MDRTEKTAEIQGFIQQGNFHAGYNIALSAMNECVRNGDQQGVDHFIQVIRGLVDVLEQTFGAKAD